MQTITVEKEKAEVSTRQFLAFELKNETYGIPLLEVQEIRTYTPATRIPNTPPYVVGVINLRGAIIAVVDLRLRMGLEPVTDEEQTIIVVTNIGGKTFGLRADSVSDVVRIESEQIQEAPKVADAQSQKFLAGLAQMQDKVIILLAMEEVIDIDAVMKAAA